MVGWIEKQARRAAVPTCVAAMVALLGGCSSLPSSANPVAWWHDLQGGAIAQDRPPPPGATDPYPNLASVPDRPAPDDPRARGAISDALVADRVNAQRLAAAQPLPDPSSPNASPGLFGRGTVKPPGPPPPPPPAASAEAATAQLSAASAPPAPPAPPDRSASAPPEPTPSASPPSRAPVAAVQSAPLPQPEPPPSAPASQPESPSPSPAPSPAQVARQGAVLAPSAAATDTTPPPPEPSLPPLPTAPPPPPSLPGAPPALPTSVGDRAAAKQAAAPAVPATPAAPPPRPASPSPLPSHEAVTVAFAPGSSALPPNASPTLAGLAKQRGAGTIMIVGYGESASSDPDAQSAALTLGLSRAQAVASVLAADGVPASALRVDAEANGEGAAARVLDTPPS